MVGKTNDSTIMINGQSIRALIDTGSDITTMADKCFFSMDPRPELRNMSDFNLNITGASGSKIPYIGYFEPKFVYRKVNMSLQLYQYLLFL